MNIKNRKFQFVMGILIILLSVAALIYNYFNNYYTAMIFIGGLLILGVYKVVKYKKN